MPGSSTSVGGSLAHELRHHTDEIVQRWYDAWRRGGRARPDLAEAALKDKLPLQLRVIGEQLERLSRAERTDEMWKVAGRLDPEERVDQELPIEEVVHEYRVAVEVVREWIEERRIDVPFRDYAYFYSALYELTAESVRRYAAREADDVRKQRALYLAGVMHQLRTPLATLSLQVQALERADHADSTALGRLKRSVRRLRVLVDGILRLERFEPEETPVHPTEVQVVKLIDDIMSDHEAEASRKRLRFEAQVDRTLRMTTDCDLFTDALGNLVHNAVKYTASGFVVVDVEPGDDSIVFLVRDSGQGIEADKLRSLFKEVQPGTGGGAGIGLQIAQHAARAQGGTIDVESEPGKGTVFSLRLPRHVAQRAAPNATP